jgi:hypothetical protein
MMTTTPRSWRYADVPSDTRVSAQIVNARLSAFRHKSMAMWTSFNVAPVNVLMELHHPDCGSTPTYLPRSCRPPNDMMEQPPVPSLRLGKCPDTKCLPTQKHGYVDFLQRRPRQRPHGTTPPRLRGYADVPSTQLSPAK